jgi:hypothetical protein
MYWNCNRFLTTNCYGGRGLSPAQNQNARRPDMSTAIINRIMPSGPWRSRHFQQPLFSRFLEWPDESGHKSHPAFSFLGDVIYEVIERLGLSAPYRTTSPQIFGLAASEIRAKVLEGRVVMGVFEGGNFSPVPASVLVQDRWLSLFLNCQYKPRGGERRDIYVDDAGLYPSPFNSKWCVRTKRRRQRIA